MAQKKKAAVPGTAALEVLLQSQSGFGAWCDELIKLLGDAGERSDLVEFRLRLNLQQRLHGSQLLALLHCLCLCHCLSLFCFLGSWPCLADYR